MVKSKVRFSFVGAGLVWPACDSGLLLVEAVDEEEWPVEVGDSGGVGGPLACDPLSQLFTVR